MSDRTYAQRLQDDEDHRLRMCGLLPEEREQQEREDFESRHYDFVFAPRAVSDTALLADGREQPGTPLSSGVPGELLKSVPPGREAEWTEAGSSVITPPCPAVPPQLEDAA